MCFIFSLDEESPNFVDDVSYSGGLGNIVFGCNYNEDSCKQQVQPVQDPCEVRTVKDTEIYSMVYCGTPGSQNKFSLHRCSLT